jgi:hypothetical protein
MKNFFFFVEVVLEVVDHRMTEAVHTVVHVLVQIVQLDPKIDVHDLVVVDKFFRKR